MTPALKKELLAETNVDTLRTLVLVADVAINDLTQRVDALAQTNIDLRRELRNEDQDVRRYELLKHLLPGMLEVAAYAGARSDDAQDILGGIDILKLDAMLDGLIAAGALEDIYDELDAQAVASLETEQQ